MATGDERVCPRCGSPAEGHTFCAECGFDLASQAELPTRAAWVQAARQQTPSPSPSAPTEPVAPEAGTAPVAGTPPAPAAGPPGGGGAGGISGITVLSVVLIVVGIGLGVFGVIRIAAGDSKVGELEDELSALQAQRAELVSDTKSVEAAVSNADEAVSGFINSAETVEEEWSAVVVAGNFALEAIEAGETPSAELTAVASLIEELGESVDNASEGLATLRGASSELEDAMKAAQASAGGGQ